MDNFEKLKNLKFEDTTWIQPSNDLRKYNTFTLENGLKVLLIEQDKPEQKNNEDNTENDNKDDEDDETDDSKSNLEDYAVCLCVNVGYFSDPWELQGVAHYLEHMIFMGNEKYPKENEYEEFLNENAGYSNAYTEGSYTKFYHSIAPCGDDIFFESLKRLAYNFISPLLTESSLERELNAIENEFKLRLTSDFIKKRMVTCENSLNNHIMHQFGWGNKYSLKDTPEKNNINVYSRIKEFKDKYYKANAMTLVIHSGVDTNKLKNFVIKLFSEIKPTLGFKKIENINSNNIKNNNKIENNISLTMEPNPLKNTFNKLYRIESIKDIYYKTIIETQSV